MVKEMCWGFFFVFIFVCVCVSCFSFSFFPFCFLFVCFCWLGVAVLTTWPMHSSSSSGFSAVFSKDSDFPVLIATSPDVFSLGGLLHLGSLPSTKDQWQLWFRSPHPESLHSPYPPGRSSVHAGVSGYLSEYVLSFPLL